MNAASVVQLITLSALWGGSFLFLRIGAPLLGPSILIESRVCLAALFLLGVALITRKKLGIKSHWKHYLVLGVLCTGIAYLIYFRLIAEIGAASALTVTFLIPVFGVLWGYLFLDEKVGWHTLAGSTIVLLGTALVTGFSVKSLFTRKADANG